ncbi:AhpC/TSA family protein [Stenotrophomonas maltophilia]|uniref:TlpA family protein disulfide reductase n=1 Tax=Stenotrophomonas chelatiphaga TaxID=517011 RepID=UPI000F9B66F6|nr:TlpA disulfide reductase family protein [Stenotrophomonas chelatiphaga]MCS4231201.1 peroxiredoxin [Stenotrophomonas chelatiphaga]ROQ45824.1 AhpC/TSA family protein [Stenotrophomonas maltophilia]
MLKKLAVVTVLLMSILVVVLALQKKDLQAENAKLRQEQNFPKISDWVPLMERTAIDGRRVRIGQSDAGRQIILLFTTKCEHCVASLPFIAEIARSATEGGVEMIGVTPEESRADIAAFMQQHRLDFPVVSIQDNKELGLLHFRMSPTFLVLSRYGRVEHVKVGRITSDEDAFGVVAASRKKDLPAAAKREEGQ